MKGRMTITLDLDLSLGSNPEHVIRTGPCKYFAAWLGTKFPELYPGGSEGPDRWQVKGTYIWVESEGDKIGDWGNYEFISKIGNGGVVLVGLEHPIKSGHNDPPHIVHPSEMDKECPCCHGVGYWSKRKGDFPKFECPWCHGKSFESEIDENREGGINFTE